MFLDNNKSTLNQKKIEKWKDDEKLDMANLDVRLKQCNEDRMQPLGGYSILFAGDFGQLKPCGAKPEQLLFSRESSHV